MENKIKNKGFEKLLKESGFVVVDGEIDYSVPYTQENLRQLHEKVAAKAQALAEIVQEGKVQLDELTGEQTKETSRASEIIARATEIVEKSQR